jgi:hypothetical protein
MKLSLVGDPGSLLLPTPDELVTRSTARRAVGGKPGRMRVIPDEEGAGGEPSQGPWRVAGRREVARSGWSLAGLIHTVATPATVPSAAEIGATQALVICAGAVCPRRRDRQRQADRTRWMAPTFAVS